MTARPRIDLDGVALADAGDPGMVLAILRYRTTRGLVLLMPESADFVVEWEHIEEAQLDLGSGQLRIQFTAAYAEGRNWLRGTRTLVGRWVDRYLLEEP